jgi:hypothetical protein
MRLRHAHNNAPGIFRSAAAKPVSLLACTNIIPGELSA